jgi:hypothetical protein
VSELYAALLLMGVTLSVGSVVVAAATTQFGLAGGSASLGASLRAGAAETQLSLIYAAVQPSGSCPSYRGVQEGTSLTVALYDFGAAGFTPSGFVVNSTGYGGAFAETGPGEMGQYTVALGVCAHQPGLKILVYDAAGDVAEFGT